MATECTCAALRQASRSVSRGYDDMLAPLGLGINQFSILACLDRLGAVMLRDLARALVMDRSTLGHLLRPLEKRGLLTLATGPDARCRIVSLTPGGRDLLGQARPLWAEAQDAFERRFGAAEAAALRTTLGAVAALPPASDHA